MAAVKHTATISTLAALKTQMGSADDMILLAGKTAVGDGMGGFYYWDAAATEAEDLVYMNVIQVTGRTTGRWKRTFIRSRPLVSGGVLEINGTVKHLYIASQTNASGDITVHLTESGASTGALLFTALYMSEAQAQTTATGPGDAVQAYVKNIVYDTNSAPKSVTFGFYKANAVTITLGLLLVPVASIGANQNVKMHFTGI